MFRARRLAPVALLAALAAVIWVGYGASSAFAFVGPNPALDPANTDQLEQLFRGGSVWTPPDPTYPLPTVDDSAVDFMKIAQDFGVEPAISSASWPSVLTLGAAALYVGWKIPHVVGISDYFYGLFNGPAPANNLEGSGPLQGKVTKIIPGTVFTIGDGFWVTESVCGTGTGATCPSTVDKTAVWWTNCTGTATACADPITGTGGLIQTEYARWGGSAHDYTVAETTTGLCGGSGTVSCVEHFEGWNDADAATAYHPTYAGNFANIGATLPVTESSPAQTFPAPGNSTNGANARTQISNSNCAVQTYLGHAIDPTWTGTGTDCTVTTTNLIPIYLPQPLPGETVQQYKTRLRASQYLGAITVTDDPMSYPTGSPALQAQPSTITGITVASGTPVTVPIFDVSGNPAAWPADAPQIQSQSTSTDIQIQEVPPDFTPAPPPPPGSGSCAGGGICIPPVNFDCQFPFGFICWAQTVTGWFNVSPQAPDFNFTIPDQTVGGNTYHVGSHYDVNLNVMDDYMTVFRGILSVVIWVGGIYWLAARLLGFHPAGDPGAAIDEGIGGEG